MESAHMQNHIEDKYLMCDCHYPSHIIRIELDEYRQNDQLLDISLSIQPLLNPEQSFFKRIWNAICYIFGHNSKFGHFEDIIISGEKVQEIINFLENYQKKYKSIKK